MCAQEVISNPAEFDEKGRLNIMPFHVPKPSCCSCEGWKNNGSQIWVDHDVSACLLIKYQGWKRRYHQGSCGWDDIQWYSYHHCSAAFILAIPVVYCFCFFLNLKRRGTDGQSSLHVSRLLAPSTFHYVNCLVTYNDTNKRHSQQWHYQVSMLITYKSQHHNDNNHEIHQTRHDRQRQLSLPLTTAHEPLTHSPTTPHQTSTDSPTGLVSGGWNSWLSTLSQQLMQGSECHESRLLWRCFDGCLIYFHLVKLQAFRWRGRVRLCFDAVIVVFWLVWSLDWLHSVVCPRSGTMDPVPGG